MPITVRGKVRICQSNLEDFNVEEISGSPIYTRYEEFLRVCKKYMPDLEPEVLFAQPEKDGQKIEWFIPTPAENPKSLEKIKNDNADEYDKYFNLREGILDKIEAKGNIITEDLEKRFFNCATDFLKSDYIDKITYCYNNHVTFVVWGMKMLLRHDLNTIISEDIEDPRIHNIKYSIQGEGTIDGESFIRRKHGYTLTPDDIPKIRLGQHYSFVWSPDIPYNKVVNEDLSFVAICERKDFEINFSASEGGYIDGKKQFFKKLGEQLDESEIPNPIAEVGYDFDSWIPKITLGKVNDDCTYKAIFIKKAGAVLPPISLDPPLRSIHNLKFNAGKNGILEGEGILQINDGEYIPINQVPEIKPEKGYKFIGWDNPTNIQIVNDVVYTAQYEKLPVSWWYELWSRLTGIRFLTLLLRLFEILFLLFVLFWLLRSCNSCSDMRTFIHEKNGVVPIDSISTKQGRVIENNGFIHPITNDEGKLPKVDNIVAPIISKDGEESPIIKQPGAPSIIGNRLFLFMENQGDDIEALAADFKKVYSGDQYSIIGFDREVKLLIVQIPEQERNEIRETLNSKIPNHKFLVFDEQIYELQGLISTTPQNLGWHLKAIHLQEGWKITQGSKDVTVAIVDDGIQANHPMFKGRIVDAYNVFTQNNHLSLGQGHGTHTAGIAAGCSDFFEHGASGIAPNSRLMPIQVFDNKHCPLSALVAGVMYAVHHDADVVNISICPSFQGLDQLQVEMQDQIARNQFKNVEALWKRVSMIASIKNCILVFAAGNDDILSSIPPENRNMTSIVVTAVDKNLHPTDFTNYGPCSDISSPGKDIYSSFPVSTFQSCDGTSMAAPIVSGTIALMKSLKKDLTVEQVRNVLQETGAEVYGNIPPMVLVDKALESIKKRDFSVSNGREIRPIPKGKDDDSSARQDSIPITSKPDLAPPLAIPRSRVDTDYDAIRRLIKEYEQKIKKLREQLPENNKK